MHPELATRRRVLRASYQRYLEADRQWRAALREVRLWFPGSDGALHAAMGNPGSRVRHLYETRMRALARLEVARQKLGTARRRFAERQRTVELRMISVSLAD
ncbi:hypothetical protein [Salipiger mucosus]|uniref:Uncharacterized protein n=1 Tax=Salipiger mucosus DSM 16094 TaxID=1123237 RepID=S9S4Y4_9RHOB|nr:hypothetical protein [Salipiger mucosus]EPX85250.1 hypothetical protein Salmuc_02629 [Salipiger mucosus DSM 16094]